MSKPVPQSIDPADVRDLAIALVKKVRFPQLATMDGDQPRVRPISPVRTDGFTVYVANLKSYGKTAEIAANSDICSFGVRSIRLPSSSTAPARAGRGARLTPAALLASALVDDLVHRDHP